MGKTLQYSLIKRGILKQEESYNGTIQRGITADKKRIAKIMAGRGTTLTQIDIEAVLNLFYQTVIDELREGNVVSTPIFRAELSLKGTFKSSQERFNHNKHKAHVTIRPAKGLNKEVAFGLKFKRSKTSSSSFFISSFYSQKTPDPDCFYPGSIVILEGKGLKLYHTKADYAMKIMKDYKAVDEADMIRFSNKRVTATLPYDLVPGIYYMEYVRKYNGKEETTGGLPFKVRPRPSKI